LAPFVLQVMRYHAGLECLLLRCLVSCSRCSAAGSGSDSGALMVSNDRGTYNSGSFALDGSYVRIACVAEVHLKMVLLNSDPLTVP
jgi:hypothetical protein